MFGKRLACVLAVTAGVLSLAACGSSSPESARTWSAPVRTVEVGSGLVVLPGTAKSNNAQPKTGDWATGPDGTPNTAEQTTARAWVQFKVSEAGGPDPILVNGAGLTLYRFDKDTVKPSKSACGGECTKIWPPVLVAGGSKIFLAGVKKSSMGSIERSDGSRQVTIDGWPVYRFVKDVKPGDTKGHGAGGTWFGVTPDGRNGSAAETTAPSEERQPATSAVLFDGKDFSDNEASQGLSGDGCENVARPGVTSSIAASGSVKIWSERDCKGRSLVVDGDVTDLAEVGFDNAVVSIFFG
ncbi:lipoprotein [Amycolatopsis keratiniphila]|uniref:Lipoprotein n=1 Tax=Amycolatopsis keratiniphila TaxID=129921 RepID=R4SZS2_9PSEU|nr:lipoprotein [Amycolatopsis keratiniphila]